LAGVPGERVERRPLALLEAHLALLAQARDVLQRRAGLAGGEVDDADLARVRAHELAHRVRAVDDARHSGGRQLGDDGGGGGPRTRRWAPAAGAAAGVAILFWSPAALPAGRTPGVTMRKSRGTAARTAAASVTAVTTPWSPAATASAARRATTAPTPGPVPTSARSWSSIEVSTVTPRSF